MSLLPGEKGAVSQGNGMWLVGPVASGFSAGLPSHQLRAAGCGTGAQRRRGSLDSSPRSGNIIQLPKIARGPWRLGEGF